MQSLKSQPIWVLWKLSDGRKRPFSALTGHETGASQDHSHEWTDYYNVASALAKAELKIKVKKAAASNNNTVSEAAETDPTASTDDIADIKIKEAEQAKTTAKTVRGIGFVIPEGYFFLDVDHQTSDSLLVKELLSLLPTYAEVSPSHNGIHFYGKCDLSRLPIMADKKGTRKLSKEYYVKNPNNGLELYIGGLTNRFSTFTGEQISSSEDVVDCTDALLQLLEAKMRKCPQDMGNMDFDEEHFIRLTEDDIPQILSDLRSQKNGEKFELLFDRGEIPARKTPSEADVKPLCFNRFPHRS